MKKSAREYMYDLRQRYLRQQRTKAEANLTRFTNAHIHLQVAALSHLIHPLTIPRPADANELLSNLNTDADYVVTYNALRDGYHPSAVAEALRSQMFDRDYPQTPEYVNQVIQRAQIALQTERQHTPCSLHQ